MFWEIAGNGAGYIIRLIGRFSVSSQALKPAISVQSGFNIYMYLVDVKKYFQNHSPFTIHRLKAFIVMNVHCFHTFYC